jgi:hypothetical protein
MKTQPPTGSLQKLIAAIGFSTLITIGASIYSIGSWVQKIGDKIDALDKKVIIQAEEISKNETSNTISHGNFYVDISKIKQALAAHIGRTISDDETSDK